MTVCFSTRAPNSDYLGFDVSPETSDVKTRPA
jgi:hypothetical protein